MMQYVLLVPPEPVSYSTGVLVGSADMEMGVKVSIAEVRTSSCEVAVKSDYEVDWGSKASAFGIL